jgi:magnesium transporter
MTLNEFKDKIIKGDFSMLTSLGSNKNISHPNDLALIISSLPEKEAIFSFEKLPEPLQPKVFSYLTLGWQKQIIKGISKDKATAVLDKLPSDDRFEFFENLKGVEQSQFLTFLSEKKRNEIHLFFGYPKNSIAQLVNTDFSTISKNMLISEAMEHLRNNHHDTEAANVIYVIDEEGRLVDDIPIRRFVLNAPTKSVEEILDGYCVSLNIKELKGVAVDKFSEYDRTVLPVVNDKNVLLGVLTIDDVMDLAEQKNTDEMQKFGGLEALDYPYVNTTFLTLIKKRAGWLIILFLSEMLTATAMGYFDAEISKAVVLALFVPLIISSGGNSGSQAATLIIRAMAVKELDLKDWWFVMRREISSGLLLGLILGTIGFIRIAIWQNFHWFEYGEHWILIALTIFFSLIGIVMWGTLSGSMVPMVLKRLGFDPAASSAPFVATLVDVTGLVIYFSIAALLLKGTLL